jgi:hypothetical protein
MYKLINIKIGQIRFMSKYWRETKPVPKKARAFIKRHIRHHIKDYGMGRRQAVRVAYEEARLKYKMPLKARR